MLEMLTVLCATPVSYLSLYMMFVIERVTVNETKISIKMRRTQKIFLSILFSACIFMMIFYTYFPKFYVNVLELKNNQTTAVSDDDFLINTPGCQIRNYIKNLQFAETQNIHSNCGIRAVELKRISEENIMLLIDKTKMKTYTKLKYECYYKYVTQEGRTIKYSSQNNFTNEKIVKLKHEIMYVACVDEHNKTIYNDVYIFVKKANLNETKEYGLPWNVLIIGMDTMSRGRMLHNMKNTAKYFKNNNWLDFRGYNKVGWNTFPNFVAFMTGKNSSEMTKACKGEMSKCTNHFLWDKYQKAGYATAYGEDYIQLPDTFGRYGFTKPPTHHFMRPLFQTGEKYKGNLMCTKTLESGKHIMKYVTDFTNSYKEENFFGLFWLNSYTHNDQNLPSLADDLLVNTFKELHNNGVFNNTFIIYTSDHGLRYGKIRLLFETYYEDLLPMLFMWVPHEFQKRYRSEYEALKLNQHRLITPYDLYLTLASILNNFSGVNDETAISAGCPNCQSLFSEVSPHRLCADVNIDIKWCSCLKFKPVVVNDGIVNQALIEAVLHVNGLARSVKTKNCTECKKLYLKRVVRSHVAEIRDVLYFLFVFEMVPIKNNFEVVVSYNGTYSIREPTHNLEQYKSNSKCAINIYDRGFCECQKTIC